ncbi:hypothetical protein [Leptospira santarosai]|uniref:hypothetical protein n=1 Tax=Leptospira santarosai TaxID=28183 RepID=UPI00077339BA|nr:hypothetical protein [Leptospira santarosai]
MNAGYIGNQFFNFKKLSLYFKLLGYIVAFVSFYYLLKIFLEYDWSIVQKFNVKLLVFFFLILPLFYGFFFCLMGYAWKIILEFTVSNSISIPFPDILYIYTKANLGKYIPGNIMEFVIRNYLASKMRISHTNIAFSSFLEMGISLLIAVLIAFSLNHQSLIFIFSSFQDRLWFFIVAVFTVLILSIFLIYRSSRIRNLILQLFKKKSLYMFLSTSSIYLLVFVNLTLTLLLIFTELFEIPLDLRFSIQCISAFVISWIIGFVVPGAPGGLGVKEATLVILLTGTASESTIVTVAMVHRIISVFGDITALAYSRFLLFLTK